MVGPGSQQKSIRERLFVLTVQHNPALLTPAIEALLRYTAPVYSATSRWAREDFEFRGQQTRRGEPVLLILASANHDEHMFNDAEMFNIT